MDVKDKIIVVTGAASGIGRALVVRFKAEGAKQIV
ncbi:MAG: short-chain dehydrogenase, partial [Porticoccaceae bacterium]|nr:short-chain dehydrogenase [Porticoccaceae bacterium]